MYNYLETFLEGKEFFGLFFFLRFCYLKFFIVIYLVVLKFCDLEIEIMIGYFFNEIGFNVVNRL